MKLYSESQQSTLIRQRQLTEWKDQLLSEQQRRTAIGEKYRKELAELKSGKNALKIALLLVCQMNDTSELTRIHLEMRRKLKERHEEELHFLTATSVA